MSSARLASVTSLRMGRRAALLGTVSIACGRPAAETGATPPLPPKRYSGSLADYVPAAGLRWLVRGAPAKLAKSQSFRPAIDLLLSPERLRAVAQTTGFALEAVTQGLVAGFDLGTLYLAELPKPTAAEARARFAARQIHEPTKHAADPNVISLSGVSEGIPVGLVTIDERVVAYGVGDPMLCRVVEAYARRKLKAKSAFQGAALAGLAVESDDALLAAHVPGPFEDRWRDVAGGLLSIATSLSAKLTATTADHATLELAIYGDFSGLDAAERLRSTYMSVAGSSTGNLLGLSSTLDARTVTNMHKDRVMLMAPLPITEIAKGIRSLSSGDLADILRLTRMTSGVAAPTSSPVMR